MENADWTIKSLNFNYRGLGPLAKHVSLQLVSFMTEQKSLRKTFEWIIIYW